MKKFIVFTFIILHSQVYSQCFPDRHSTDWFNAWISCKEKENPNPANDPGHWILFDLKNQYTIDKIKIWNVNDPDHLDWGMKDLRIEYSLDSIIWNSAGEIALLRADGTNRYEGMDWMDVTIPKARYILLTAVTNFGGKCAGLAEIRFSGEKIEIVTDVHDQSENRLSVKLLPNPFTDVFRAEFTGQPGSSIDVAISDLFGKTIYSEQISLENGYNSLLLQTRKWASGAYIMTIKGAATDYRKTLIKL